MENGDEIRITKDHFVNFTSGNIFGKRYSKWLNSFDKDGYKEIKINGKKIRQHRFIYELYHNNIIPDKIEIDHINHNRSDNRIENLRLLTRTQNCQNNRGKGYYFRKDRKKWVAYIYFNKKKEYLGSFLTKEEAREAYVKRSKYYNEFHNGYYNV